MSDVEKARRVGHIDIIVTKDMRLFLVNPRDYRRKELTNEYHERVIDEQLMDELEHRFRGTHPFEEESLLSFLRS